MTVAAARRTFFFDVVNFPAGGNFAVAANDASAAESGETEKPNQTHRVLHSRAQQYTCRMASRSSLGRGTQTLNSVTGFWHRTPAPKRSSIRCDRRFFESHFRLLESVARREQIAGLGYSASRRRGGRIDRQRFSEVP